jgi:nitrogen fixation protein NifU and related proteins
MQDDLRELYQQTILDHGRKPRNFGALEDASHEAEGFNPLCGDQIRVFLKVSPEDSVDSVRFTGSGCTICTASASLMTATVQGKSRDEIETMFQKFHDLVVGPGESKPSEESLGKLAVFGGVREFPIRVKCATLPWHTLKAALDDQTNVVSTE